MLETISTYVWQVLKCALRLKEITAPTAAQIPEDTVALYCKDKAGVSNLYFKNDAGVEIDLGAASAITPSALTRTDDTNVTLTLTGTPATALLESVNIAAGWSGQLSVGRGGTGVSSLGTLTKVDDTNVTLTLGGTPANALINAVSLTLGWTGQLSIARGGTGQATANAALNALLPSQGGNSGKVLGTDGSNTSWVADATGSGSGASGHFHSLTRLLGDGSTTTFNLSDYLEYLDLCFDDGIQVDSQSVTLSADGSQVTFGYTPAAGNVIEMIGPQATL